MTEENLVGFGECVLALHDKLRKFIKQSDLFEELNSMIHKMMDTTVKRRYSMGHSSRFSKNSRETSVIVRRNSTRPKKVCYSFNSSNSGNSLSDFKMIKPCFVKLDKICDLQLSKLLAKKMYSDKDRSNSRSLKMQSLEMTNNNLRPDRKSGNNNIEPEFLATEDHLDLLMAKEMEISCALMEKRLNGSVKNQLTKGVRDCNPKPVVLLKRLSPELISKALNGKLEMDSHEINRRRKQKVSPLQRMAVTNEVRRSKRSSVLKLGCSCCSKSTSSEDKEAILGNKENIPRPRKRPNEKLNKSDDEEEFYGFENQTKNVIMIRHRIKKMKEALRTLNALPSGKERHRILKVKEPLKSFQAHPSGKENGRTTKLNSDIKSFMKNMVPFKAVNRVEAQYNTNEDNIIFQNPMLEGCQSYGRDKHLNGRNKMLMVRKNNAQCTDAGADVKALNRMEVLELFKKREKLLISKMVRDQGKIIVSKTGELMNEDEVSDKPLNYYSDTYYIKKTGRRIPLWAEKSITNVIIESQEQIPMDIIVGYFQDHDLADPTSIATFLGNAFLQKDNTEVTAR